MLCSSIPSVVVEETTSIPSLLCASQLDTCPVKVPITVVPPFLLSSPLQWWVRSGLWVLVRSLGLLLLLLCLAFGFTRLATTLSFFLMLEVTFLILPLLPSDFLFGVTKPKYSKSKSMAL
ncbi:hypothetical protein ACJW30_01G164400 [Castanea mollissima]